MPNISIKFLSNEKIEVMPYPYNIEATDILNILYTSCIKKFLYEVDLDA